MAKEEDWGEYLDWDSLMFDEFSINQPPELLPGMKKKKVFDHIFKMMHKDVKRLAKEFKGFHHYNLEQLIVYDFDEVERFSKARFEYKKIKMMEPERLNGFKGFLDTSNEKIIELMEKMYGPINLEHPLFHVYFEGIKERVVEMVEEIFTLRLEVGDKWMDTVEVANKVRKDYYRKHTTIQLKTLTAMLNHMELPGLFLFPPRSNKPDKITIAPDKLDELPLTKEHIRYILKLMGKHPFGILERKFREMYQKEFSRDMDMNKNKIESVDRCAFSFVWTPSKEFQMEGLGSLVFEKKLKRILPPVKVLAWLIFHKIQILVAQSPSFILNLEDVEGLMKKNFGLSINPEAWGFDGYDHMYQFLFDYFVPLHKDCAFVKPDEKSKKYLIGPDPETREVFHFVNSHANMKLYSEEAEQIRHPKNLKKTNVLMTDTPVYAKDLVANEDTIRCATIYIHSYLDFYIHLAHLMPQFKRFEELFNRACENLPRLHKPNISSLLNGRFIAVNLIRVINAVDRWYRARVLKVVSESEDNKKLVIVVHLIDYGNVCEIQPQQVQFMSRKYLLEQPAMAIPCRFQSYDNDDILEENKFVLGQMLEDYINDDNVNGIIQLVKFHHPFTAQDGRVVWRISSTLVHPFAQKFIKYQQVNRVLSDIILDKFNAGEREKVMVYPEPEPDPVNCLWEVDERQIVHGPLLTNKDCFILDKLEKTFYPLLEWSGLNDPDYTMRLKSSEPINLNPWELKCDDWIKKVYQNKYSEIPVTGIKKSSHYEFEYDQMCKDGSELDLLLFAAPCLIQKSELKRKKIEKDPAVRPDIDKHFEAYAEIEIPEEEPPKLTQEPEKTKIIDIFYTKEQIFEWIKIADEVPDGWYGKKTDDSGFDGSSSSDSKDEATEISSSSMSKK